MNADGYASTGTDFLGYNMFAYCENNPVKNIDPAGRVLVVSYDQIASTGSLEDALEAAWSFIGTPERPSSEGFDRMSTPYALYNCFQNATSQLRDCVPRNSVYSLFSRNANPTSEFIGAVLSYFSPDEIRQLKSLDDPIGVDENLVVLKCGAQDFHFVVQINGVWHDKHGSDPLVVSWNLDYLEDDIWEYEDAVGNRYTYNYETVYFAIKKEW